VCQKEKGILLVERRAVFQMKPMVGGCIRGVVWIAMNFSPMALYVQLVPLENRAARSRRYDGSNSVMYTHLARKRSDDS
jgi:hypothetical protein